MLGIYKYKDDLTVPGTTVLLGDNAVLGFWGLKSKAKDSEVILIPQPSKSPNDPLNWPTWRKQVHFWSLFWFSTIMTSCANFVGPIYTNMAIDFNVSYNALNTGAGVAWLMLGVSCLFSQPLARKFGRRPVYLSATLLVVISGVVFGSPYTFGSYMAYNVLVGIGSGPVDSLIEASIADIFFLHQHGKYMAIFSLALGYGSGFGPLIAGYVSQNMSVQWCGFLTAIIAGSFLVFQIFFLEESLFQRKIDEETTQNLLTVALSNVSGGGLADSKNLIQEEIKQTPEDSSSLTSMKPRTFLQRMKPFSLFESENVGIIGFIFGPLATVRYPAVIWAAIAYGIQCWWLSLISLSESEFYAVPPYNFSNDSLGLLNIAMIIGTTFGTLYASTSDTFMFWATKRNKGIFEPEPRLWMISVPLFFNVVGIFMYGLGPYYGVHWIVGAIGIVMIGMSMSSITALALTYVMECYPAQLAQCMAFILFVRNIVGAIFTWVFQYWIDGVGMVGTTVMLAVFCLVVNGVFLPFILWGKTWRKRTQKWYSKHL
ncbi:unnamed protein product [Kuraishia capsulata CBS 1993]|uniref:Major facilitator superfamily (MFS) profile domain-containing protein n=1 Tax=Kuraishia capsulata CBS 1993 TaxID=1382522 RepID=W6ML27_9ASCO|nr:uncharacterized protein KUCA_T00003118001 [Kuraishia capsulata CBS 1993]CDK27141.1 unnamed protein product [Kuraishia capsulata CBS 1993]